MAANGRVLSAKTTQPMVIQMAKEAGALFAGHAGHDDWILLLSGEGQLYRFAAIVATECALIAEQKTLRARTLHAACNALELAPCQIAAAIRERFYVK